MKDVKFEVVDDSKVKLYNHVTHDFITKYGAKVKPLGLAVHSALLYFANKRTKETWASQETIGKLLGVERHSVGRAMDLLYKLKIIIIYKQDGYASRISVREK